MIDDDGGQDKSVTDQGSLLEMKQLLRGQVFTSHLEYPRAQLLFM